MANKISDEEINEQLRDIYHFLIYQYGSERILGLFAYGKVVHGFLREFNNKDIILYGVYIPTFEELCCGQPQQTLLYLDTGINIHLVDLRRAAQSTIQLKQACFDSIFSPYTIINPRYATIFNENVFYNREAIFHSHNNIKIKDCLKRAFKALDNYKQTEDPEYVFEACRIRIASELFFSGTAIENCIRFSQDYLNDYLWSVLEGKVVPDLEDLENALNDIAAEVKDEEPVKEIQDIIEKTTIEIIKLSHQPVVQGAEFIEMLSDKEKLALDEIKKELASKNYKGNVSISKLTKSNKEVSRPVYTNLFNKMQDNSVAIVKSHGAGGTYIELVDPIFFI